jgi:hypothetical protein
VNAALVHAVLAGGVNDPRRLARWSVDPLALRALGVDPASFDLQAMRGLVGLALKVRHNGLRDAFPHTFRLLNIAGLEIDVFAEYALARAIAGVPLAPDNEGRAEDLVAFIERWHDGRQRTHALLWDLARHEHALFQLTQQATTAPAIAPTRRPTAGSVPRVRGAIRLHEMQHDPLAIVAAVRQREATLDEIKEYPCAVCYRRAEGESSVHVVELDAFAFAAMQVTAEGCRSVADMSATLGFGGRPPARMLTLLAQLGDAGLLTFSHPVRDASS